MYNLTVDIKLRREPGAFESIEELGGLLEAFYMSVANTSKL